MKNSSCRGLEVFDFKEEDEDLAATKILGKFRNPNMEDHSVLKYKFLECVASVSNIPTRKTSDVPCVDIDTVDDDHGEDDHTRNTSLSTIREENATKESNDRLSFALQFDSIGDLNNQEYGRSFAELEMRTSSPVASSAGRSQSNCDPSESLSNNKSVDLNSDADDDNINEPASSVASEDEEDVSLDGHTSDYCLGNQLVDSDKPLVLFPEYAIYRGRYYTEPWLAFSPGCIKFTGSTTCLQAKSCTLECSLDDIVNISCLWSPTVEMVLIKINIISKDELQTEDMQEPSGIEELKFAVVDARWSAKQEMIRGLHEKYAAVWDVVVDLGMGVGGVDADGQRHYFPDFDEPFEDFVYPKGDSDAVSISKRDVDLLQPETFINDTIIDFYIKYLKNQIQHEERRRFHFFNSFFFRKLADLDKDPSSASDGRAAFLRVRKWTRKINLFEKDYIFIPVNYNLHWSLIVICHPGEVANFGSEDLIKSTKLPCILHMDSIRGSHTGLKNLVQSYLWEEWKEKGNENSEQISERFSNMRFVHLELPQQENSYDCGLFLLHYLELFLTQAPLTFNPLKISKFSRFLNADWFPPVEASLKRTVIQKLIYELLGGQSQDVAYPACSDRNLSKTAETKTKDGFSRESLVLTSPVVACQSVPQACNGIEISSQADSSLRNSQNANNESGLVLREFFEPGPTAGSFLGSCQSFNQQSYYRLNNSISALETEDVEMGAAFGYEPYGGCGEADFRGTNGVSLQTAGILFGSHVDDEVVDSPDASPQASDGSSDIAIYETSINNNNTDLGDDFERYETPQAQNSEHFVGIASSSAEVVLETVDVKGMQESKAEVELGTRDIVDEESIMRESKSEVMLDTWNVVDKVSFIQEGKLEVGLETMDADGVMQENQEQQRVLHPESPGNSSHHEEETVLCPEVENANTELQAEIGVGGSKSEQVVTEYVIPNDPEDEKPDAKRRRLLEDGDLHL